VDWVLRALVALGLVVDAVVHLHLASGYQLAQPGGIGQGNLFRVEGVVAVLAAGLVLLRGGRTVLLVAAAVALSALAAVVLYRYVQVPAIGPIPSMYEPVWFFQKSMSAVAEGLAGLVALLAAVRGWRSRRGALSPRAARSPGRPRGHRGARSA
jgi:hypothetical protein